MNTEDGLFAGCGCLLAVLLGVVIVWFVIFGIENSFNESNARIESLRADAAQVDPQQAEDVIGQVSQWNQHIVSEQYNNTIPIIGFFTSDRWNDVELIPVPRE